MELCSANHDEVCYKGRRCPVCIAIGDYASVCRDLTDLQKEKDELQRFFDNHPIN